MKEFTFLISTERSGSNFLAALINGHPLVSGPPPTHLFRLFANNRGNYGDLDNNASWTALVEDVVLNFACGLGSWKTSITEQDLKDRAKERSVAELLRIIYESEADCDRASHIFVKENHTYSFAPFILAHFPNCRLVYLVRDPRDVASSWACTRSLSGGVAEAVDVWVADQSASLSLANQLRDTGRMVLLRYENLVNDTEQTLQKLTGFLNLPYQNSILDFYRQPRTIGNAERIEAWTNLSRPVMRGNTGKYRSTLSTTDIRYIELSCHRMMRKLGYSCDFVTEPPDEEQCGQQRAALRLQVNTGKHTVNHEEQEIRDRRLAAINRVLSRRFP